MEKEKEIDLNDAEYGIEPVVIERNKNGLKNRIIIGAYPDINGENAIPQVGILPTKAEIYAIIKYHIGMLRSVDEMFAMGHSGSWEIRQLPYSNSRVIYYTQFVDQEIVNEIFDEVYKGFDPKSYPDEEIEPKIDSAGFTQEDRFGDPEGGEQ